MSDENEKSSPKTPGSESEKEVNENTEQERNPLFLYIGNDQKYWDKLRNELTKKHEAIAFEFDDFFKKTPEEIQSLILKIYEKKPHLVFIDFSKYKYEYLHLARLLRRMSYLCRIPLIGLLKYDEDPLFMDLVNLAGVRVSKIKSGDIDDIIYHTMILSLPDQLIEPKLATGKTRLNLEAYELARIGYAWDEGLHIETNTLLTTNQRIEAKNYWYDSTIVFSPGLITKEEGTDPQYYNFSKNFNLNFEHAQVLVRQEDMSQEEWLIKEKEYKALLKKSTRSFKEWCNENETSSNKKALRTLIVDDSLALYNNQRRSDSHSFLIRCQPYFFDIKYELEKLKPHLIFFTLSKEIKEQKEIRVQEIKKAEEKNEIPAIVERKPKLKTDLHNNDETLKKLIEEIKAIENYNPILLIFNSLQSSDALIKEFKYEQMISSISDISLDFIINACNKYEKKITLTEKEKKLDGKYIFFSKTDEKSIFSYKHKIYLNSVSETSVQIGTETELSPYSTLKLEQPAKMFITIIPLTEGVVMEACVDNFAYKCVIHSIDEIEKMKLRQFINDIFFQDLQNKKAEEKKEYDKIQNAGLKKKQEDEKKKKP